MTTRIALSALIATIFFPSALAEADNPRLVAIVGTNNAFVIGLRDAAGKAVTHLDSGTYTSQSAIGPRCTTSASVALV